MVKLRVVHESKQAAETGNTPRHWCGGEKDIELRLESTDAVRIGRIDVTRKLTLVDETQADLTGQVGGVLLRNNACVCTCIGLILVRKLGGIGFCKLGGNRGWTMAHGKCLIQGDEQNVVRGRGVE